MSLRNRNQLQFLEEEDWPGGGEYGDGRDLYGAADRIQPHRHVTDRRHEMASTPEDFLVAMAEGHDAKPWPRSEAHEDANTSADVTVNGEPLEEFLVTEDAPFDTDVPDALALASMGAFDDNDPADAEVNRTVVAPSPMTAQASRALKRFERDGITKVSSRLAAKLEHGWDMVRFIRSEAEDRSWKRHRQTRYRPVDHALSRWLRWRASIDLPPITHSVPSPRGTCDDQPLLAPLLPPTLR